MPAVDARLTGVERREVTALASGLLEVVSHHRGQEPSAAVVGMDAHPGQSRDRHGAAGSRAVRDRQLHRAYAVDAGVGARIDLGAHDLGGEPLVGGDPTQLELGRLVRHVVEPHQLVGGEVAVGVSGAVHADVGHAVQQTRGAARMSTRLSTQRRRPRQWAYWASSPHAPSVTSAGVTPYTWRRSLGVRASTLASV